MFKENENMLFDINKLKCEIIIVNEMNDLSFNEVIKRILLRECSSIFSPNNCMNFNILYLFDLLNENDYFSNDIVNKEITGKNPLLFSNRINMYMTFVILKNNSDKSRYINQYNRNCSNSENKDLKMISRLFLINNEYYLEFSQKKEKKDSFPKYENGIIYSDCDENNIKNIFKENIIKIIDDIIIKINNKKPLINKKSFLIKDTSEILLRIEEYLQINNFDLPLQALDMINDKIKGNLEKTKIKEVLAITKFLKDYQISKELIYKSEIKKLFEECIKDYNKLKEYEFGNNCILRICTYLLYFNDKFDSFIYFIHKIFENNQNLSNNESKLLFYLKSSYLFKKRNLLRNQNICYFYALSNCDNLKKNKNLVFHLLNNIRKDYFIFDIYEDQIHSLLDFEKIHSNILKTKYKQLRLNICLKNKDKSTMKEYQKKKIETGNDIYITSHLDEIKKFLLFNSWDKIQQKFYIILINYMIEIEEITMILIYYFSYLQSLNNFLPKSIQQEIYDEIIKDSIYFQKKLKLSLLKMPILLKITPISSKIKFDEEKNKNLFKKENQLFLYNPWEKKNLINLFFWTKNSYQYIIIKFKNILKIELTLTRIYIIFETKEGKKKPISYPSTIKIFPESSIEIISKIKLIEEGLINIIGVTYDFGNVSTDQFVDFNGRGFFSTYNNYVNDSFFSDRKKQLISLRNIRIYNEIPLLEILINNDSIVNFLDNSIIIYDFQDYMFNFSLKNVGKYPIDDIKCFVFAYKKDDNKITLKEFILKNDNNSLINVGETYNFNFLYSHLNIFHKIEFRIYYNSILYEKENEKEEIILKPYIFDYKMLNTQPIFLFQKLNIFPKIDSNNIEYLIQKDSRIKPGFKLIYGTEIKYCSFVLVNENQNKIKVKVNNTFRNESLEEIIDNNYSIQISILINNSNEFFNLMIYWNFLINEKINGKFFLKDAFQNYDKLISNEKIIEMSISVNNTLNSNIEYSEITYSCINKTESEKYNLKIYIYIYEIDDKDFIINEFIPNDELFYEGTLICKKNILKINESFSNVVKLYKVVSKNIRTTFAIIDNENKIIYLSPNDKQC